MNIILRHRDNETGKKLLGLLIEMLKDVESRDTYISGFPFLEMEIKTKGSARRILNSAASIKNCLDRETMGQILESSGISYGDKPAEMINKYYDILLFDMNVIAAKVRGGQSNSGKYIKETECAKIADLARKALYILGLDYGLVTVALTGKGKTRVLDINDSPEIRNRDMNILLNNLTTLRDMPYPSADDQEVKIGADPEFMLLNSKSGRMMAASDFFPRAGIIGCDNIRIPNRQQRPVAEVRPQPTTSPVQLTDNIKEALVCANKLAPYRNVRWLAGSQPLSGYSIGGHIHFSNVVLNSALIRALDNYLGVIVFLVEDPESAARRRKKYGRLADIRLKEYGGFEYRTLGSWLVTPEITRAVLCLAKVVAEHYLELNSVNLNNAAALQAFYKGDQEYFRPLFGKLWRELMKTPAFQNYQNEMKVIPNMIDNKITWDEHLDLRLAWNVGGSKRQYNSDVKTKKPNNNNQVLNNNRNINRRTVPTNRGRRTRSYSPEINSGPVHTTRMAP